MKRNMAGLVWTFAIGMWAAGAAQGQVGSAGGPGSRAPGAWEAAGGTVSRPARTLPELDLRALGVQFEAFQAIMNRDIAQAFEQPFVLLQDTKGTYLPGYGAMFHLEVNLHPLRTMNMFNMQPYTAEELRKAREAKLAKIRELKTRLSALLLQHGTKLTEVPADQNVIYYRFKFDYYYNRIPERRKSSKLSPEYKLVILD